MPAASPTAAARPGPVPAADISQATVEPKHGGEVALADLLAYADQHAPALRVARSTRRRADAAEVAASVLLPDNPQLTVGVGPRIGGGGSGVDVDVGLSQPIQIAGERRARLAAAEQVRALTDAEVEQVRWAVHCDVHAGFHRALIEGERAQLAAQVVAFQEEVLQVVERQIAAGETAPLTLRLAQAEVAQARQVLVAADQAFLAARIRLAQLSGWPVEAPPMPAGTAETPREPPPLETLLQVARERLPSLRTAAARVREAEAREVLARREAYPRPAVGVQFRRENNAPPEPTYNVVLGVLSTPIPSFQRNQGERARARADISVADAELAAALSVLDARIAEARSEVAAAAQRTLAYGTEILPHFEENLRMLRRAFELGEIDLLALSAGRERFLRIQSDAIAAKLDYFVSLAALERVVGVDLWHHDEESP